MIGLNLGSIAESVCDSLGLPEQFGDIASLAVDYSSGNYLGMAEGAMDLCEDVTEQQDAAPYAEDPYSCSYTTRTYDEEWVPGDELE